MRRAIEELEQTIKVFKELDSKLIKVRQRICYLKSKTLTDEEQMVRVSQDMTALMKKEEKLSRLKTEGEQIIEALVEQIEQMVNGWVINRI